MIALLYDVIILLVLVVWPVGLDDSLSGHTVDSAGNAAGGDELSKVTSMPISKITGSLRLMLPV